MTQDQPEDSIDSDGRPGIYLPPAMLQPNNNELLLVMLAPPPSNPWTAGCPGRLGQHSPIVDRGTYLQSNAKIGAGVISGRIPIIC